jgi:hypothetical protein
MKPLLKLAFVALLIGMALEMPTRVKAADGWYYCDSVGINQCMASAQQTMSQCSWNCAQEGGGGGQTQLCYSTQYWTVLSCGYVGGTLMCTVSTTPEQECFDAPQQEAPCETNCANTMSSSVASCWSEWCTSD